MTVAGSSVESFILTGSLSEVALKEEHRSRSREFDVGPGDGVYFSEYVAAHDAQRHQLGTAR